MSTPELLSNVLVFPGAPEPEIPAGRDASFQAFLDHVEAREVVDAADCLAALLALSEERAYHCTLHFLGNYRRGRSRAMGRIMRLTVEAHEGNNDTVLLLLRESFGLVGTEAHTLLAPLAAAARPA
ncbi:MAG: hypothetical protein AB8H79_21420 [Myxococcota bacterium]